MVVCWYRWNLLGELTVLLLIVFGFITPVIGFIIPVIGLITPVIGLRSLWLGSLPLWLDFGPCDWVCTPAYLTSDWGWVWYDGWCEDLVVGVESLFSFLWFVSPCVFGWYLVVLGNDWLFLMIVFCWYLGYGSLWSYAFVVGYWLCLDESWFMIRSAYCCWVSALNYWTVCWRLYSIWVCKPIYKLMYIYIPLRVWMVVA